MRTLLLLLFTASIVFSFSCTKKSAKKTTCSSSILMVYNYGNYTPLIRYGVIDQHTAGITSLATFTNWSYALYDARATYNTSDNCYYTFKRPLLGDDTLLKINSSGAVTILTKAAGDSSYYRDVLYNPITDKLYCLKEYQLAEINITGSTFTASVILADTIGDISTVNNTSGDIYFVPNDTSVHKIRKYYPGASSSTIVATIVGGWSILGLRFNKNDNQLYAIRENLPDPNLNFIKIDPVTGTSSILATYSFDINREFYSAEIDPCSNQYILSSSDNGAYIKQISMTGTVVQSDSTTGMYLGLAIH